MAQVSAGRDSDSLYVEDCRQVQSNTHTIQTLTGQISRLVGTLETDKDFQHCRKMVDDSVRQASETRTALMRIQGHQQQAQNTAEKNNRRMMYHKLSDNLAITARVLEDVVRRFTAEERKRTSNAEEVNEMQSGPCSAADAAGGHERPLLDAQDMLDQELREDRCQALQRVDNDMRCLQRIYTDLANTAEQQRSSFDSLESHMCSALDDVEAGREEISIMRYRWDHSLKHKVWAGLGTGLAVVTLGAWFFG